MIAAHAAKSLKEVTYHLRHSAEWVVRLGDGTDESKEKIQTSFLLIVILIYGSGKFSVDHWMKQHLNE
jgi:uncharacterized membrane protein YphA (DoxX/SURF4 family)